MSKKELPRLSPANYDIMRIIWEKGETTISEVMEIINSRRREKVRRTSIQVQMNRLEKYGWLKHRQRGRTFFYFAAVNEVKARRDILKDIQNRVFGGSRAEMVKCLFDNEHFQADDISELRKLVNKHKEAEE